MIQQQVARLLSRRHLKLSSISARHINYDGEVPSKTHMSMITKEDESHNFITAYSNHGLRLSSGLGVIGPCAIFPRSVLHWNVNSADKITPESLSLFTMLEPKLDILIIGKGDWDAKYDINIVKYLRSRKINVEILPTEQACTTFNFLNSERRVVAAAIIPPTNVPDEFDGASLSFLKLDSIEEIEESDVDRTLKEIQNEDLSTIVDRFDKLVKTISEENPREGRDNTRPDSKDRPKK